VFDLGRNLFHVLLRSRRLLAIFGSSAYIHPEEPLIADLVATNDFGPAVDGAGLASAIHKNAYGSECGNLIALTLGGIPTLECLLYAIMYGTVTFIL